MTAPGQALGTPSRAAFAVAPIPAARDLRGNGRKAS
jgi:hypothetical protein